MVLLLVVSAAFTSGFALAALIFRRNQRPHAQVEGVDIQINSNQEVIIKSVQKVFKKASQRLQQESAARIQDRLDEAVGQFDTNIRVHLAKALLEYTKTPLPQGTRFIVPYDRCVYYVVEQPPGPRTIRVSKGHDGTIYHRTLSFPYMIFLAGFNESNIGRLYVACRNSPLESMNDPLLRIHLSNIYKGPYSLGICEPSGYKNYGTTPGEQMESAITRFWQTRFTGLGMESHCSDKRVSTPAQWEAATKKNRFFATDVAWHGTNATPNLLIRSLAYEGKNRYNSEYRREAQLLSKEVSKILTAEVQVILPENVELI